jgi:hypothetical protein
MPDDTPAHPQTFTDLLVATLKEMGADARKRGERDYALGIDLMDGYAAFVRDGATPPEVTAYNHAYMRAQLRDILITNNVPFEEVS